jgi:hypothetical protein
MISAQVMEGEVRIGREGAGLRPSGRGPHQNPEEKRREERVFSTSHFRSTCFLLVDVPRKNRRDNPLAEKDRNESANMSGVMVIEQV